jgi:hypothetical protein
MEKESAAHDLGKNEILHSSEESLNIWKMDKTILIHKT